VERVEREMDEYQEKVRTAAACIAGTDPAPDWLISVVGHAVGPIHANYEISQAIPTRSAQREKLEAIRAAAKLLAEQFTEWTVEKQAMLSILEAGGLNRATVSILAEVLPKLAAAAAAAPTPGKGQGRDKPFPNPDAMTPQKQCAALVGYGWRHVRGKPAPHTSEEAHRACDAVWQAAGLPGRHQWGDKSTGWSIVLKRCNDLASGKAHDNGSLQIFLNLLGA
jgi:hypothetical protein